MTLLRAETPLRFDRGYNIHIEYCDADCISNRVNLTRFWKVDVDSKGCIALNLFEHILHVKHIKFFHLVSLYATQMSKFHVSIEQSELLRGDVLSNSLRQQNLRYRELNEVSVLTTSL